MGGDGLKMDNKPMECPIAADVYQSESKKGATREAAFKTAMSECSKLYRKEHPV
jgi:hypothetical protein